jgi:putative molybdopterin biosynthesis protein
VKQRQFLEVVDEAVARRRFAAACAHLEPRVEMASLEAGLGRVLAGDVVASVDVTPFDRSNVDGFAVRAADTFGAEELNPVTLHVADWSLAAGDAPPEGRDVSAGEAVAIATGAVVPRGADAVVMVEHTELQAEGLRVLRPVVPGDNVTFAGSDIGRGEVVVRRGVRLTSRETGVLAAVGASEVGVYARPRVAVVSTGDEIVAPGRPLEMGHIYDSNQRILLDAVAELGCQPVAKGIVPDDERLLEATIGPLVEGPDAVDVVLLSGGTSKGEGDLNATVVHRLAERHPDSPGVVVHGVALKPGKPIMLAVVAGTPLVVLPGFPTSAIFTFWEFVAPLLRRLSGVSGREAATVKAVAPLRIASVPGRTEYSLVDLVEGPEGLAAYPLGAGSGSVTALGRADGFVRIPASVEYLETGTTVEVRLLNPSVEPADLVAIGSHCIGLDHLLGLLADRGYRVKMIPVGSTAGLAALARGEGDVAGVHLLDPGSGEYNTPFLPEGVAIIGGYGRRQVIAHRAEHTGLGDTPEAFLEAARERDLRMVNRNPGSGTRVLIDGLLGEHRPDGYLHQAKTHHAVAAAVAQGRADWGITLDTVAAGVDLQAIPVADERYDLAVAETRRERPAVAALAELLADAAVREALAGLGFVS